MFLKHLWRATFRCIILISYIMIQYLFHTWNVSFQILSKLLTYLIIFIKKHSHYTFSGKRVLIMVNYQNQKISSKSDRGSNLRREFRYIREISTNIEDTRKLLKEMHIRFGLHLKNNLKDERSSERCVLERLK